MSRLTLTRFARLMHTSGRQIPNPGQGGAPALGSISPSPHSHTQLDSQIASSGSNTSAFEPELHDISELSPAVITSAPKRYSAKGKMIASRPASKTPVYLPSGYPEPSSYPPSADYLKDMENTKRASHPLWQFFHVPANSQKALDATTTGPRDGGSLEVPTEDDGNIKSGRSWAASELRQKSFGDLHTLWYVLLKELNVLATQREERRRLGISPREGGELISKRAFRCRKSMARIKYVLNERRLGLLAAASPLNPSSTHIPFSASPSSDPFAGVDALRGTAEIPTWIQEGPTIAETEAETGELDAEAGEHEPIVSDAEVGKEEVESRDEGFGGGEEAKEFVRDVQVDEGGHVVKK